MTIIHNDKLVQNIHRQVAIELDQLIWTIMSDDPYPNFLPLIIFHLLNKLKKSNRGQRPWRPPENVTLIRQPGFLPQQQIIAA